MIGRDCWINVGCHIDASDDVSISDRVAIARRVMILTNTHRIGSSERHTSALLSEPVTIGDGCWLGTRVVVLPGVRIGPGSIVAAGAVVTRDVPPDTLVAGVPATLVRDLG